MKRSIQQAEPVTQLSLFESQETSAASLDALREAFQCLEAETDTRKEPKEVYERRRTVEMAEKLGWPTIQLEPLRCWPGVTIPEGAEGWHDFLAQETSGGTIGLVMIALHKQLDPLTHDLIDATTGLHRRPVEVISQVEERLRTRMIQLAEVLGWPLISYWAAHTQETVGSGKAIWQKYFVYGSCGHIADTVGALERRLRGEPEQAKQAAFQQPYDDEEI